MKFQTPYNRNNGDVTGFFESKSSSVPSMTIPDESLTIKQILDRYSRGLPLGGQKVPIYDEDNDLPDPRRMDLAEIQQFKEEAEAEIKTTKSNWEKQEAERKKKQAEDDEKAADERFNKRFKKMQDDQNKKDQPK